MLRVIAGVTGLGVVMALAAAPAGPPPAPQPIGRWAEGGDVLELYAERGDCPDVARRAVYTLRPPASFGVPGCYVRRDGIVWLVFTDGDRLRFGERLITWARGHAPATL